MHEGSLNAPIRHPLAWQDDDFYDAASLDKELRRVFDICHGCRRCFNLCDSFPRLFELIDATQGGEVRDAPSRDFERVTEACTLCDMCFMTKCPYVPPHEFNVDFPHLMLRHRSVLAKSGGMPLLARELTKTDRNGRWARFLAPLINWFGSSRNRPSRRLLEMMAQVHKNAHLPRFAKRPFLSQAKDLAPELNRAAPAYGKRKAVLYATCSINYNDPELGMIARRLLAANGVETQVAYPSCCGMPQLEGGDLGDVAEKARKVAHDLAPYIEDGYAVVALVPSCALMLKLEWPLLVPASDPSFEAIKKLASSTFDLCEYIVDIAKTEGLAPQAQELPGPVALHIACHARAQNMGAKAAEMLNLLAGETEVTIIERCSGHGGSWGIMAKNFPVALKIGKPVARRAAEIMTAAEQKGKEAFLSSECPLAGAHIAQGVEALRDEARGQEGRSREGRGEAPRPFHPVEIFALAYGIAREAP